jgi:hypothetical protein
VDEEELPRWTGFLLFAFGAGQFFVNPEPGVPDLLFPFLLVLISQRALLHPVFLLLLAGNVLALVEELLVFDTVTFSLVSTYLTLSSVALYSVFTRYGLGRPLAALLLGGATGAALSLAALLSPLSHQLYTSGIRFTGFFKDPNVTGPTALFFAFACLALAPRWRWAAVAPSFVFAIAISRATFLAAGVAAVVLVFQVWRSGRAVVVTGVAAAALLWDRILAIVDSFFDSIGRGGLLNSYDEGRRRNWAEVLDLWLDSDMTPLGPGFTGRSWYGLAMHSTYLRLMIEQGIVVLLMFAVALLLCWRATRSAVLRAALVMLAVNGVVVDATHWRVLFLAVAVCLAATPERMSQRSFRPASRRRTRHSRRSNWQAARRDAGGRQRPLTRK